MSKRMRTAKGGTEGGEKGAESVGKMGPSGFRSRAMEVSVLVVVAGRPKRLSGDFDGEAEGVGSVQRVGAEDG